MLCLLLHHTKFAIGNLYNNILVKSTNQFLQCSTNMYQLCIHWDLSGHVYIMIISTNINNITTNTYQHSQGFITPIYSVVLSTEYILLRCVLNDMYWS